MKIEVTITFGTGKTVVLSEEEINELQELTLFRKSKPTKDWPFIFSESIYPDNGKQESFPPVYYTGVDTNTSADKPT